MYIPNHMMAQQGVARKLNGIVEVDESHIENDWKAREKFQNSTRHMFWLIGFIERTTGEVRCAMS